MADAALQVHHGVAGCAGDPPPFAAGRVEVFFIYRRPAAALAGPQPEMTIQVRVDDFHHVVHGHPSFWGS